MQKDANPRMPVLFVGHGSPMHAIEDNQWSRSFAALGQSLPRPRAILVISAHWYVQGSYLTGVDRPRTIHDFGGFPQALFEVQYPAPGNVDLAGRVRTLLGEERAALDTQWGFDHGTWCVLRLMYPQADIPVIQLSIDRRLRPQEHYDLARPLAELRDEGVLILGSGNIVHNLPHAFGQMRAGTQEKPTWATQFDSDVASALRQHDARALVAAWPSTDAGRMSHPTPDHWLPLLYAQAASVDTDDVTFPTQGFDMGSISMRQVRWG